VPGTKIASSRRQIVGLRPNFSTKNATEMVSSSLVTRKQLGDAELVVRRSAMCDVRANIAAAQVKSIAVVVVVVGHGPLAAAERQGARGDRLSGAVVSKYGHSDADVKKADDEKRQK